MSAGEYSSISHGLLVEAILDLDAYVGQPSTLVGWSPWEIEQSRQLVQNLTSVLGQPEKCNLNVARRNPQHGVV